MNRSIKFLLFFIYFLITLTSKAQTDDSKIKWGPALEGKGVVELIGTEGDYIFATQKYLSILKFKVLLLKIDKNTLRVVSSAKIPSCKLRTIPLDFSIENGTLQALVVLKNKQFRKIIYDFDMNELSNELVVKFDKNVFDPYVLQGQKSLIPTDLITAHRSKDKSKVIIKLLKAGKKRSGVDFFTFDLKSGLKELPRRSIKGSQNRSIEKVVSLELLPSGNLNLLMKRYIDGKNEEKNDKPNYDHVIYKFDTDDNQVTVDLPIQNDFWSGGVLKSFDDGSIIVTSKTLDKPKGNMLDYQLVKISNNNDLVYNKFHEIKVGDGVKVPSPLNINMIQTHGNGFLMTSVSAWTIIDMKLQGRLDKDENIYKLTALYGFDQDGESVWREAILGANKEKSNMNFYSGPLIYKHEDGLLFYLNSIEKNINPPNQLGQKSANVPNKKTVVLESNISFDGELTFNLISDVGKKAISTVSSLSIGNEMFFIGGEDVKFKKMYIGKRIRK